MQWAKQRTAQKPGESEPGQRIEIDLAAIYDVEDASAAADSQGSSFQDSVTGRDDDQAQDSSESSRAAAEHDRSAWDFYSRALNQSSGDARERYSSTTSQSQMDERRSATERVSWSDVVKSDRRQSSPSSGETERTWLPYFFAALVISGIILLGILTLFT